MKSALRRTEDNVLLIIGVGFLLLGILAFGTSHTLGGFLYVGLLVGFILVAVALGHRLQRPRR